MSSLPVAAVLPELLSALQHAPQVLLNAPTGAGKSTAAAADPRRGQHRGTHYPARAEARRRVMSRSGWLNCESRGDRGFPHARRNLRRTADPPEVVTEDLTRMIQRDPELTGVGLVILDEFHERSLQADLAGPAARRPAGVT